MLDTLGHYKILDRLGTGGIGDVYRARDTRHGRTVAIKVAAASIAGDPARRERFLHDAREAAALSHPNIADLFEIGDDSGRPYLVFEFVPGETLRAVIAGRPLNPRRAIDLAVQIADALADAHASDIVHGDLKPDNVIVTPKGNAKILDFGLADWTTGGSDRAQAATLAPTSPAAVMGSVAYMSPEQALGERADARSDVFSLGIILFEMLTGRLPFNGTPTTPVTVEILQAQPPAPSSVIAGVPPELDAVVLKALAKSLDQRYESAATFAAELRSVAAILDVRSEVTDATRPPMRPPTKNAGGRWLVILMLLAAIAAAAWLLVSMMRP